jgi:hypothetical protein
VRHGKHAADVIQRTHALFVRRRKKTTSHVVMLLGQTWFGGDGPGLIQKYKEDV